MNAGFPSDYAFAFCGARLVATASGVLFWPDEQLLCVSDLHFGKAQRYARLGGAALPPYETRDTLERLDAEIERLAPRTVICLGDSFDSLGSEQELDEAARGWITRLQAGRSWIWIEGNHDPGPLSLGGTHRAEHEVGPLVFRHIATPGARGEISGHYHPKGALALRGRHVSRPVFAIDDCRIILPAFGTFTGGLSVLAAPLSDLIAPGAVCVLTGPSAQAVPLSAFKR